MLEKKIIGYLSIMFGRNKKYNIEKEEKAIATTLLKTIDIKAVDNLLEFANFKSLSGNGTFDNFGCHVKCILKNKKAYKYYIKNNTNNKIKYKLSDNSLNGLFDLIIFYNIVDENNIAQIFDSSFLSQQQCKIIILNTELPSSPKIKVLINELNLKSNILIEDNFSVIVIENN